MECEITYEKLAAFSDGDAEHMNEHVRACAACRTRLMAIGRIDRDLRLLPRAEPSTGAMLAARRAIARETRGVAGPEVMTLAEVAEFLRVPPDALADVAGELPAFEIGGQVRVRRERLVEWIAQRERTYARSRAESEVAQALAGLW